MGTHRWKLPLTRAGDDIIYKKKKKIPHTEPPWVGDGRSSRNQHIIVMFVCVCAPRLSSQWPFLKVKTMTSRVFPLSDVRQMDVNLAPKRAASSLSLTAQLTRHLLAKITVKPQWFSRISGHLQLQATLHVMGTLGSWNILYNALFFFSLHRLW